MKGIKIREGLINHNIEAHAPSVFPHICVFEPLGIILHYSVYNLLLAPNLI